jgi:predicted DNA-binding transcriptional regulator YafY
MSTHESKIVNILYTNYRGETGYRNIIPHRIWFGSTQWHPADQWLLDAHDVEKNAIRNFAMSDIKDWTQQ